jgi:hypothetical protein
VTGAGSLVVGERQASTRLRRQVGVPARALHGCTADPLVKAVVAFAAAPSRRDRGAIERATLVKDSGKGGIRSSVRKAGFAKTLQVPLELSGIRRVERAAVARTRTRTRVSWVRDSFRQTSWCSMTRWIGEATDGTGLST